MKKMITISVFALSLCFISCGDDDPVDCTANQFTTEVNAAITDLNAAASAWANDPTNTTLCNSYVDAANGYLDAVEGFDGCGAISQADYQAQIDQARDALDQLPGC